MIFAAALAIGGALSILAGLVSLCIHMTKRPPRNRYRNLPPPSRDTLRRWNVAER